LTFLDRLNRIVRGRSRTVSRPLALAGVAALSLTPLAIAAPAGAAGTAQPLVITMYGGAAKFHVAGHSWEMTLSEFPRGVIIDLLTGPELDDWNFEAVPSSDFKANARAGTATYRTRTTLAPIVVANLRFSPTSKHKGSCQTGSETYFDGKLTGSISLAANKRLKFKSAHVTFRGASLDFDRGCLTRPGPAVCDPGFWSVGETASASGTSLGVPGPSEVSIDKFALLPKFKDASVAYEINGAEKKPVFDSKAKRLSVKANGAVKGSAVLVATGPPDVSTSRCSIGHTHYKERTAEYLSSYSSPAGGQFRAHSIIAGLLKVARSGTIGSFSIASLKKT
jgi:hypothetical protein